MFTRRRLAVIALVGALLIVFAIGCGPKPPCPVGPSVVKMAQDETESLETSLGEAQAEKEVVEKELSEKEAKLETLEGKPEMLRKKLDALKKGSGR